MIDKYKLKSILSNSFNSARKYTNVDYFKDSNALKSAKFVSIFAQSLFNAFYPNLDYKLNVIKVDDEGNKYSGEWLLDITITEDTNGFKKNIILGVESESNTSEKAFNDDFAKLIHTKAKNYIYLNGLNQKTPKGKQNYIRKRLLYAKSFLNSEEYPSFFFGFWTSPQKNNESDSIWSAINNGKLIHLKETQLYEYNKGDFYRV